MALDFASCANSAMVLPTYFWFSGLNVFSTFGMSQRLWKLVGRESLSSA